MATSWDGKIVGYSKVRVSAIRTALAVEVRWRIYNNGQLELEQEDRLLYPLARFRGMTAQEVRDMIVNDGVNGMPALKTIGAKIKQDWDDAQPLRQFNLPVTFGP